LYTISCSGRLEALLFTVALHSNADTANAYTAHVEHI